MIEIFLGPSGYFLSNNTPNGELIQPESRGVPMIVNANKILVGADLTDIMLQAHADDCNAFVAGPIVDGFDVLPIPLRAIQFYKW